jgi:hypothetical protein
LKNRLLEKWGVRDLRFENDEDEALSAIVSKVNRQSGGRAVLNALITYIFDPLAEFLFSGVEHSDELKGCTILIEQAKTKEGVALVSFSFRIK